MAISEERQAKMVEMDAWLKYQRARSNVDWMLSDVRGERVLGNSIETIKTKRKALQKAQSEASTTAKKWHQAIKILEDCREE